jgi:hypothetical protein
MAQTFHTVYKKASWNGGMSKSTLHLCHLAQKISKPGCGNSLRITSVTTYREFVKHMLPHVRAKGLGPQAAMKTVAMMWRKHKGQRGKGLTLTSGSGLSLSGAQQGMGFASSLSSGAKGTAAALGLAGLAQPELAPILEPAAGVSAGVGYIADLFK